MNDHRSTSPLSERLRSVMCAEVVLVILTLVLISAVHTFAIQSRLLMTGYYIIIWAVAFLLMKRRRLTMMVFVLTVTFGMDLAESYVGRNMGHQSFLSHVGIDIVAWSVLLFLFGLLAREAYVANTEMRRLELKRAIEKKVISARSAALTCMAHELRTPIASVVACVETLESTMEGKIDDIERRFLKLVHESSRHLVELVDNLLDYGKARSGSISFKPQEVDFPELIEAAVAMIEPQGTMRDITISAQVDTSVGQVVADPLHLRQIVLNLLSNAVKHSPAGAPVKISVTAEDCDVVINVSDTGKGMTVAQVKHIFDPYYQTPDGGARPGTGLGLGIVHLLVKLHGGSISVQSAPGEGSEFSVRLPRQGIQKTSPSDREETWEAALSADQRSDFSPAPAEDDTESDSATAATCV